MYPVGSNGASQSILDARALAWHLSSRAPVEEALAAYEAERHEATSAVVMQNRRGGNEGVIDFVEARAPEGFDNLDAVATHEELQAIVVGYSQLAGFAPEQVNRR